MSDTNDLAQLEPRSFPLAAALSGWAVLTLAYVLVFASTLDRPLWTNALDALSNSVPALILGVLAWFLIDRFVFERSLRIQLIAHIVLAAGFALAWYFLVLVVLGARNGWLEGFDVEPFAGPAFIWQLFQGVTLYAVVALGTYMLFFQSAAKALLEDVLSSNGTAPPEPNASQVLFKVEKEIVSLGFDEVVRVSGAGDYVEVITPTRSYLSTTSLAKFEDHLPEHEFARAHRSHIVRLEAIERAESAGNGRLTLLLKNGDTIETSRSGARRIKQHTL